jgi:hypothetical protein
MSADQGLLKHLFTLMDVADEALDKETYDQFHKEELDLPDDCEIWITVGTTEKINKVFAAIESLRNGRKMASVGKGPAPHTDSACIFHYCPTPDLCKAADFCHNRRDGKVRFPNVSCSQCGKDFGPGNHGFSHCASHAGRAA